MTDLETFGAESEKCKLRRIIVEGEDPFLFQTSSKSMLFNKILFREKQTNKITKSRLREINGREAYSTSSGVRRGAPVGAHPTGKKLNVIFCHYA